MCTLTAAIIRVLCPFEGAFRARVWEWAKILMAEAILAPAAARRVMGLGGERQFQNFHRVLNRAVWSGRALGRILLLALVRAFVPAGAPVVVGMDDTIERRRGAKIAARGIYRDPARSSEGHFVKASGLRWQLEVTFEEARARLGLETQRQWSELAILRTTPALLGQFSLVTLFADARLQGRALAPRQTARNGKSAPTFSDTLALVRGHLWPLSPFPTSPARPDVVEIPRALVDRLTDTLANAA